jgi:excisionase family DNA binding protein
MAARRRILVNTDELLTTAQAAPRLGCSIPQVKAMCQEGKLPARKVGRDWVIRVADLDGITVAKPGWPAGRPRTKETER